MDMCTLSLMVAYRVYHGLTEMEGGVARRSSAHVGSIGCGARRGWSEITMWLCSQVVKGGGGA
jgi:hypothetical protein